MLVDCYECNAKVSDKASACPHCGALNPDPSQALPVDVSDFEMKFSSMVWFLIKVAFAAVPAVIVIYTAWTVIGGVMNPLLHM